MKGEIRNCKQKGTEQLSDEMKKIVEFLKNEY
jgi:hypothetical protein